MPWLVALLAGAIFGAGLTISDMINPARVLNFLDFAGSWDASLLVVMGGALAVTLAGYRFVLRRETPLFSETFYLPSLRDVDAKLIGGAALFGVGWGLAGICPGPALTLLVSLEPKAFIFLAAMLAGMAGGALIARRVV